MWKKIRDFIKQNQDTYNDFYSELSGFNESLNYLRHNRKKRKLSITRLIVGSVLGIPTLLCGIIFGAHLAIMISLGLVLGIGMVDSLITIIKYRVVHNQSSYYASNAYDFKVKIDRSEKCFKKELIESLTEQDCTIQNLNDLKSRLIDLEFTKQKLKKSKNRRIVDMSIDNEIELTEYLLKSVDRLMSGMSEENKNTVTVSKINEVQKQDKPNVIDNDDLML